MTAGSARGPAIFATSAFALDATWPYIGGLCSVLLTVALALQRMIGVRQA